MARTKSVYRRYAAGSEPTTSGDLADAVPGLPERRCDDIANGYCQTLRAATPDSQHNNRRTGETRFSPNDAPGRAESRNVPLPNSEYRSDGLNVSAFADVNVSAFVEIPGQHLLTYPRRIQNDAICILPNTAILILHPTQNGRLRLPAASVVATQAFRVSGWQGVTMLGEF